MRETKGPSTWNYAAADLHQLGLLEQEGDTEERMFHKLLSKEAKKLLRQAGVRVKGGWSVKRSLYA